MNCRTSYRSLTVPKNIRHLCSSVQYHTNANTGRSSPNQTCYPTKLPNNMFFQHLRYICCVRRSGHPHNDSHTNRNFQDLYENPPSDHYKILKHTHHYRRFGLPGTSNRTGHNSPCHCAYSSPPRNRWCFPHHHNNRKANISGWGHTVFHSRHSARNPLWN